MSPLLSFLLVFLLDSLSECAARPGDGLAQVHRAVVFHPIGRQVQDLQGRVLLQHLGQVTHAVTSHAVTAETVLKGQSQEVPL